MRKDTNLYENSKIGKSLLIENRICSMVVITFRPTHRREALDFSQMRHSILHYCGNPRNYAEQPRTILGMKYERELVFYFSNFTHFSILK